MESFLTRIKIQKVSLVRIRLDRNHSLFSATLFALITVLGKPVQAQLIPLQALVTSSTGFPGQAPVPFAVHRFIEVNFPTRTFSLHCIGITVSEK